MAIPTYKGTTVLSGHMHLHVKMTHVRIPHTPHWKKVTSLLLAGDRHDVLATKNAVEKETECEQGHYMASIFRFINKGTRNHTCKIVNSK